MQIQSMPIGQTYLHLNIQYANPSLLPHVLHRLYTRPVEITPKLSMLNESRIVHKLQEFVLRCEVILHPVLFGATRGAGGVGDGEAKSVRIGCEEAFEECGFAGA